MYRVDILKSALRNFLELSTTAKTLSETYQILSKDVQCPFIFKQYKGAVEKKFRRMIGGYTWLYVFVGAETMLCNDASPFRESSAEKATFTGASTIYLHVRYIWCLSSGCYLTSTTNLLM